MQMYKKRKDYEKRNFSSNNFYYFLQNNYLWLVYNVISMIFFIIEVLFTDIS